MSSNELVLSDRGGTSRFRPSILNKYAFDDIDEEDEFESYQKEEDVVTPYSICN